jgi:hypothetical protein
MALAESAANLVIGYGASVALSWWLFGVTPGHAAGAPALYEVGLDP